MQYRDHSSVVLDCQLQDVGGFVDHLVSGSADGEVRVVDPRRFGQGSAAVVKQVSIGQKVSTLSIHQRAPAFAAWTASQVVCVHTLLGSGSQLNIIKHTEGLLGHRRGPVGCLSFHPNLLQLAMGPADGSVTVYDLRQTQSN